MLCQRFEWRQEFWPNSLNTLHSACFEKPWTIAILTLKIFVLFQPNNNLQALCLQSSVVAIWTMRQKQERWTLNLPGCQPLRWDLCWAEIWRSKRRIQWCEWVNWTLEPEFQADHVAHSWETWNHQLCFERNPWTLGSNVISVRPFGFESCIQASSPEFLNSFATDPLVTILLGFNSNSLGWDLSVLLEDGAHGDFNCLLKTVVSCWRFSISSDLIEVA
jgi:hypothetical protein